MINTTHDNDFIKVFAMFKNNKNIPQVTREIHLRHDDRHIVAEFLNDDGNQDYSWRIKCYIATEYGEVRFSTRILRGSFDDLERHCIDILYDK
jgi:hypothetical protein